MTILILGLLLWMGGHFFRRLFPAQRAAMGSRGRGLAALVILAGLVAMIFGYRAADVIVVWSPPPFLWHVNNLLMLIALWVFGSSQIKGGKAWPASRTRHPQLLAVKIWALAHLLVNGDLASVLLFGGLMAWAVGEVIAINRAEPQWTAPTPAGRASYVRLAVITLVLYGLIGGVHIWLGVAPFPG
jgi:uncharacterized membrane protein